MTFEEVAEKLLTIGIGCEASRYKAGWECSLIDQEYTGWGSSYLYTTRLCTTLTEAAQYIDAAAKRLYPDTYGKEEA